jgi:hypothetical protein
VLLGTHWESDDQTTAGSFGEEEDHLLQCHKYRLRVGKGQIMCCLSWLSPPGPTIYRSLDI